VKNAIPLTADSQSKVEAVNDTVKFMQRFRGVPAHVLAAAMNKETRGLNWSGCPKSLMAERYAKRREPGFGNTAWTGVTLASIAAHLPPGLAAAMEVKRAKARAVPYTLIEKPQVGYAFGAAYEVWQGETMVSRHPNKSEATNARKRFRKQDAREALRRAKIQGGELSATGVE
jgi:hypothetical protein